MLGQASRMYEALVDRGHAELDTSAVVKLYETAAGAQASPRAEEYGR